MKGHYLYELFVYIYQTETECVSTSVNFHIACDVVYHMAIFISLKMSLHMHLSASLQINNIQIF